MLRLQSGDIALFSGNPLSHCSHGVLGVDGHRREEVDGFPLPAYVRKSRLSVQVRNMAVGFPATQFSHAQVTAAELQKHNDALEPKA